MVVVGVSAYNKASDGMTEKFKETSIETIKMMREYLDMTNSFIKSEGMKYGASDNISDYSSGNSIEKLQEESATINGFVDTITSISTQTNLLSLNASQAEKMVALQTEAVMQVINVFDDIRDSMKILLDGLKDVITSTQKADVEKNNTLTAVENISAIIEEAAAGSEVVHGVVEELVHNVEKLNHTSDVLSINMQALKNEIESFITE